MRQILLLSVVFLFLALPATTGADPAGEENTTGDLTTDTVTGDMTLIGAIEADRNLTEFARALDATNLTATLQIGGPYTVFAPEDSAFAALGNETAGELMNDTERLRTTLESHVVRGDLTAEQLKEMVQDRNMTGREAGITLQTLSGENLTIDLDETNNRLTVSGAMILTPDINTSNGTIHTIDQVLMPADESKVQDYIVTGADNNETVVIPLTSAITVRLPENPSTPYFWNVTVTRGMELVGETFIPESGNESAAAPGIREWHLVPNDTGTHQFTALLQEPGENTTETVERFQITMQVVENRTDVFTGADNGGTVTLSPGTYATVRLDENPSTGYVWNVSTTDGLTIVGDLFTENETGLVGAGGTHEWFFRTADGGRETFSAVYKRPWENATSTDDRFILAVNVSDTATGI